MDEVVAAFIEHFESLWWRPKFPNGSCGSAPTVNMTNTFLHKKKKKVKRPDQPQNSKFDAIPNSEF